jgi:hypothetical protein
MDFLAERLTRLERERRRAMEADETSAQPVDEPAN